MKAGSLLLVDDEPQVVDLLRDFFEEQGYSVMSALNGRDALVLASLSRPDTVLLDIRMPDLQGPEVLRQLRALDDSISVVMVSGTDDEDLARDLLKSGALDYVRKPFMFEHLDCVVRTAVLVGKRVPLQDLLTPNSKGAWAPEEDAPDDPWCARCQEAVSPGDTSAVRERGAIYHAACWLARGEPADRPRAAR
jgi:DNA-binding NtrC family response regulator